MHIKKFKSYVIEKPSTGDPHFGGVATSDIIGLCNSVTDLFRKNKKEATTSGKANCGSLSVNNVKERKLNGEI